MDGEPNESERPGDGVDEAPLDPCSRCGATSWVPIMYGLPVFDDDLMAALDRGDIATGGCVVSPNQPLWQCRRCEADREQVAP